MTEKYKYSGKVQYDYDDNDLLYQKVKWTEDGFLQLGTVTQIFSERGIKYLNVMSMFGKRCKVKMSKVRLISELARA